MLSEVAAAHPELQIQVDIQPTAQLLQRLFKESLEFFVADISQFAGRDGLATEPLAHLDVGLYVRSGHSLAGGGVIEEGFPQPWVSDLRVVRLAGRGLSPAAELLIAAMKRHLPDSE